MDRRALAHRRARLRLVLALPLSLLGHAVLVGLFLGLTALTASNHPPRPKPQPITFRYLDSRQWAANQGRASPALERPAPLHPRGQVVDVAPGNRQVPVESKYLAETNNRVDRETRARVQTNKYSVATAKTSEHPELMPARKGTSAAPEAHPASSPVSLEALTTGYRPRFSSLFQEAARAREPQTPETQEPSGLESGEANPARSGDASESGGGAPNDDLQDVAAGEGTALNTREWKFASFFNRVKQAISAHWDPNARLRARGGTIGFEGRHTLLHITLRPDGSLADVYVARSCGLDQLDIAAVQAVERAQPFLNPPAALVEQGFVRFQFSFSVTNEGMSLPQMFRPHG